MNQRIWSGIPSCMFLYNWSAIYYVSRGFVHSPFRAFAKGNARWVTRGSEGIDAVTLDGARGLGNSSEVLAMETFWLQSGIGGVHSAQWGVRFKRHSFTNEEGFS